MSVENRQIFLPPCTYSPRWKGPLEFGIGARGPKCFYDGATRWRKKFYDRFSRFDTIPAVTDTQPPSQPPNRPRCRSKDALCISASRSKNGVYKTHFLNLKVSWQPWLPRLLQFCLFLFMFFIIFVLLFSYITCGGKGNLKVVQVCRYSDR